MNSRIEILRLYRSLLKACGKFEQYNYREYALERVKHDFRANRNLVNQEEINLAVEKAKENLVVIQRQAEISTLYPSEGYFMEHMK